MPLMGSLYIGSSGLQTSQNAMNTVAHNITNADTAGYVRESVLLSTRTYNTISINTASVSNQQIGLGVYYSKVSQNRDYFLDQSYRKESGRSAFYEASSDALDAVGTVFGELYGATFSDSMDDLWTAIQELAKTPTSSVNQGLLVQYASTFIESAQAVYQGLEDYQDNLNLKVKSMVNTINDYGDQIKELNGEIVKIESGGVESANDLRDERNLLLDELTSLANIAYAEDATGVVTVKIEGTDFVTTDKVYEIAVQKDNDTGFYTPYWKQEAKADVNGNLDITNAKVFNLTTKISTDMDTDVGQLKAVLLARGDKRADYTDIPIEPVSTDYPLPDGTTYAQAQAQYNTDKTAYDKKISQSIIVNVMAEFDQLIHNVTTTINKVLADAADKDSGYLCDSDGNPLQLFTKIGSDGYNSTGTYVEEDSDAAETLYSVMNLQVNRDLTKEPTLLGFKTATGASDYTVTDALKAAFSGTKAALNPNVTKKSNFVTYYSDLVSQISNSASVYSGFQATQETTVAAIETARQQVIGVSTDEELTYMIQYQNAYNAASRYINVIDEMLEHLINKLG